jgi:hypothetical protein
LPRDRARARLRHVPTFSSRSTSIERGDRIERLIRTFHEGDADSDAGGTIDLDQDAGTDHEPEDTSGDDDPESRSGDRDDEE